MNVKKPRILILTTEFHHAHRYRLHNFLPYLSKYLNIDVIDVPLLSYDRTVQESLLKFIQRAIHEFAQRPFKIHIVNNINIFVIRSLCPGRFGMLCSTPLIRIFLEKLKYIKTYTSILVTPLFGDLIRLISYPVLKDIPIIYEDVDRFYGFFKDPIKRTLIKALEYNILVNADVAIAVSPYLYAEDIELRKGKQTFLIPNGIEFKRFRAAEQSIVRRDKNVIVYVGAIEPWSGLDITIKAFKEVVTRVPEARLYVIGEWRTRFGVQLIKMVKNLNLIGKVIFLGRKNYEFILNFLPRCRIGVSTFPESEVTVKAFPYKVLEYCAAGLPVVMTRVGYLSALAEKYGAGRVHNAGDIEGLASSIIDLIIDEQLWKEYSERAVKLAALFDIERLAKQEANILMSFVK
jgi:glycosyltransferase involved in cell wall biosynthesis